MCVCVGLFRILWEQIGRGALSCSWCLLSRLYNLALSTLLGGCASSVEVPSVLISSFTESLKGEESQFIHLNP